MTVLRLTTCQAENTRGVTVGIARYLSQALKIHLEVDGKLDWRARYTAVRAGRVDIAWICGWPYHQMQDSRQAQIELLAAPVYHGVRYAGRPRYFSDMVASATSPLASADDLHEASVAVNEPGSLSGYHSLRDWVSTAGRSESGPRFRQTILSGGHARSIELVAAGAAEVAAIDSTFLAWLRRHRPDYGSGLRVIGQLGPYPIPPLIVQRALDEGLRRDLRQALLEMHHPAHGRGILTAAGIDRFAAVTDSDYDPLRRLAQRTGSTTLTAAGL